MPVRTFVLHGEPTGCGKNSVKTTRTGRRYPNPLFEDWKEKCQMQIFTQLKRRTVWTGPIYLVVHYYPANRRVRDATAILDGIFHVLEYTRLIEDDKQIKGILYNEYHIDKKSPRIEVELQTL